MKDYTSIPCPICNEKFDDAERPVVCPDCGAPFHRDCYAKEGKCPFEEAHKTNFTWKTEVDKDLDRLDESFKDRDGDKDEFYKELKETLDKMGVFNKQRFSSDERMIFGVSEKEIAHFQGGMNPLRFMRYRKIAAGKRISLNIFAALFSPYFLFYSRMRFAGIVVGLILLLFGMPVRFIFTAEMTSGTLPAEAEAIAPFFEVFMLLNLAVMIILALFYDYFYLKWATSKIKSIRSRFLPEEDGEDSEKTTKTQIPENTEEYYDVLQQAGRPGFLYMVIDSLLFTFACELLLRTFV